MDIIDTHCHMQMPQYEKDRDAVIRRALDAGVRMICVGVDLESSRQAIALAERYEGLWASVGLHPNDNLDEKYDQASYEELARHPKVVAIGEIGLDYYRTTDPAHRVIQKERFMMQLDMAIQPGVASKPLIVHCRDSLRNSEGEASAHEDMISILERKTRNDTLETRNSLHGVIHSFTGTSEQAERYIKKGYCIGVNGIVTFTHQYDEMIRSIPPDRLLLETDAPYLAPVPHRGKRNEPSYIVDIAKAVSAIKGIPLESVVNETTNNAVMCMNLYR